MQNKYGFTLVEVLVASLILSVVVFGILRLVNNNSKQTNNLERNNEIYEIYDNSLECIKSFGYNYFSNITSTQSLNFGINGDECLTGTYNSNYSFSGVEIKYYFDNKQTGSNYYRVYFVTNSGTNLVNINTYITNGIVTKNFNYKIWK